MRLNSLLILSVTVLITLSGCGGGGGSTPTETPTSETVNISGKITYDLVPVNSNYIGLDYDNTTQEAAKFVLVDAINISNQSIASTSTDVSGNYTLTLPINTQVKIRVSAKLLKKDNTPSWDVKVVDHSNSDALYVMEGILSSAGTSNSIRNLNAPSGWGTNNYTSTRVAAPFAMLDTIYSAMQKILTADAQAVFPPLVVNWYEGSTDGTYYTNGGLYIFGDEDLDTDEYDDHIIAHEWGHYYEDKFSRTDSIGGSHSSGDILDIRVAFGEGWGNAFSGIALDDPVYFDTLGTAQSNGWNFNVESGTSGGNGWYSEFSIQRILYDLYDSSDDGVDTLSLGFTPIHQVFTGAEETTPAFTSIFTFIKALKDENEGDEVSINTIVSNESIATINDIYGTGRTNLSAEYPYIDLTIGTSINICLSTAHGTYNKLSNRKYVKFTSNISASHTISVTRTSGDTGTDPDVRLYQALPFFTHQENATSSSSDVETKNFNLISGSSYLLDIYDDKQIADTCYAVSVTLQ